MTLYRVEFLKISKLKAGLEGCQYFSVESKVCSWMTLGGAGSSQNFRNGSSDSDECG